MRRPFLAVFVVTLAVTVAGCEAAPAAADPASVVQAFFDALNAGDVDEAMSYVAEDALFIFPEVYIGKEQIRDFFLREADSVTWSATVTTDDSKFEGSVDAVVQEGKIVSLKAL